MTGKELESLDRLAGAVEVLVVSVDALADRVAAMEQQMRGRRTDPKGFRRAA